jgi:hypothetical protein
VLGIVDQRSLIAGQKNYVDATGANTAFADGSALVTGPGLNQWHLQSAGNGGSLLSSADAVGEHAPMLLTRVTVPASGTYDLWVNFWGNPATNGSGDWRIQAGLDTNLLQVYRARMSETVDPADYSTGASLVLTNNGTNFLYQAYVGRVISSPSNTLSVFVDDYAMPAGASSGLVGDTVRTWFDGVSYAPVKPLQITSIDYNTAGSAATITWNSPAPGTTLIAPTYTLQKKNALTDPAWTTVATGIASGGFSTTHIDNAAGGDAAFYRVTTP